MEMRKCGYAENLPIIFCLNTPAGVLVVVVVWVGIVVFAVFSAGIVVLGPLGVGCVGAVVLDAFDVLG